jgi:hypothetical protein
MGRLAIFQQGWNQLSVSKNVIIELGISTNIDTEFCF